MQNYVSLQIRSAYQQYLKSRDSFDQTERDLKRSREYKKIVETKTTLGQTSEYERKEADALLLRVLWRVENARVEIEKSYLNTAVTASWGKFYE